jgi:uncharacterized protein YggU (UPF0235/DUF167 family)
LDDLLITTRASGARLQVRVKPRASRSAILETTHGILVVALAAPPVDGEANAELLRVLAAATGLPRSAITLASGTNSRTKLVDFAGVDAADLKARLTAPRPQNRRN